MATAAATTPAAAAASDATDGPVLTLINKRIRNLKKKLNRIAQIEQSAVKNKEQEDLLKSKPSIAAAVDELEKLRLPLSAAVDEEIAIAVKVSQSSETLGNVNSVTETETLAETLANNNSNNNNNNDDDDDEKDKIIEDLLRLIYIGNMFDVKTRNEFESIMLTSTHERNCCLTYDYVTDDDAAVVLGESDLDLLAKMSSLLISRPVDLSVSHQDALRRCVEHAKRWLAGSEEIVEADSAVTYAALREKLTKIIGSDYLKITPEMKAPDAVAAEAAGNYVFQVPVQVENTVTPHEQTEDNSADFQRHETHEDQSTPVEHSPEQQEPEAENTIETQVQVEQGETNAVNSENKEQYVPRRYNQRGGGRSNGGGRGGRGYGGGRGGRSGGRGGPYQNGRNQYYEQQGNYYQSNQRNYYGGRGRGGRGGGGGNGNGNGNGYNHHHGSGVEVAES